MSASWPRVRLGEILKQSDERVVLRPDEQYQQVTVQLWGKGVTQRNVVYGSEIGASTRCIVRSGQFILSRIDARHGAFGLVPNNLDAAVTSNDFPVFNVEQSRIIPEFLGWLSKTRAFIEVCRKASEGTTNRVRLKLDRFLATPIALPSLDEQRRLVARIEELAARIEEARGLRTAVESDAQGILLGAYSELVKDAHYLPMVQIAPVVRRPVEVKFDEEYYELGIRSFGKGTFHKPPLRGSEVGTKRIFWIEPGDLLFSNVFAWEGAIAVVKPADTGRVGSHRFISCVPRQKVATATFLCFHFHTPQGIQQIGEASPGGAGRNRTLGIDKLQRIEVPVPAYEKQVWFDKLYVQVDDLKRLNAEAIAELDLLLPSILDKAFKGEL